MVSGSLVTSHATQQSNGHKYQMAGTFSHSCCLCHIWYPHFSRKRIQFWCDNKSVVALINLGHSKAPRIMDLLRFLVLLSMKHNFYLRARDVPRIVNEIADALSRFQDTRFRAVAPQAESTPCTISPSLMILYGKRSSTTLTGDWHGQPIAPAVPGSSVSFNSAS